MFFFVKAKEFKNSIIQTSLEKFVPFYEGNILPRYDVNFRVTDNSLKIEAASAFYPFAATIVQNIYDKDAFSKDTLKLVSTGESYKDIVEGKTDIVIATAPSDEQKELIENSKAELEFETLYLEPIIFFVNKENNIENLSIKQIQDIYYSDISNWKNFGEYDGTITTYQLEKNNGSQTSFETLVKNNKIGKNHVELHTMPEIIDRVALNKKGIGYAFDSYYNKMYRNNNTKIINVDNIKYKDSNYPMLFEVYFIYRKDNTNENIRNIINWLKSEEGNELIKKIVE